MSDKYPLTDSVECQVTLACATVPRFMKILGFAVEPDKMPKETSGIIVQAAQTLSKENPCSDPSLVLQHVQWRVSQGQLTTDQLEDCEDYLDLCEGLGVEDVNALVTVVKPIIQRSLHEEAVDNAIEDFGKGRDIGKAAQEFAKISSLGTRTMGLGHEGQGLEADILESAAVSIENPLPTGITDVDIMLEGGLEEFGLGMVLGGSGDGKSLFLSSQSSEAIFNCLDTAIVTLELSEAAWRQRIYSNLLNMTPRELKKNPKEAARRYKLLQDRPQGLGRWQVNYMTPLGTTPNDVRTWLRDLENERKFKPDLLIIDYADKMVSDQKNQRSYEMMRDIYIELRKITHEEQLVRWVWTASQTRGREGRKKKTGLEDTSDSAWKFREPDLILGITRTEDDCADDQIRFNLPKRRNASAHGEVGPLPMDAERWRIAQIVRKEPW